MAAPSEFQVALLIGIGTVGMIFLAIAIVSFMVFYQKRMIQEQFKRQQLELDLQKKMMEAVLESQENERRRIAGDLHDSIGAMLSTVRVSLITQTRKEGADVAGLADSKKILDETIESVRRISRDLMPSTLEKFGLLHAVKEMCERFETTTSMPIKFADHGDIPPMVKSRELMIFRIIQELLNNAIKHAQASMITVTFDGHENLVIAVEDDGVGFDAERQKNDRRTGRGLGLFNMENRARVAGAALTFDQERQKGSRVVLTIPYEKV